MEQSESTSTESSPRRERSSELIRPIEGRMLAGVAQGFADNFGISEWIPRVFFVVTAFMGGLGLALYAAGWAFIRSEDEAESPADRFFSGASTSRSWIGIGLMVIAGIIVLSNFTFFAGEVVWALAFLIVGLLLYLGYIPSGGPKRDADEAPIDSEEGVQRMTTTDTLEKPTVETPSGDSPAGGPPPSTPSPTPPSRPPAKPKETSILGRLTIGMVLLSLGVLAVLDNIDTVPIDAAPRHYMALAVTGVGVGLLVGSIAGRARWLILLGAIMVPTLLFSPVFEYRPDPGEFDFHATPTTFDEVEPSYRVDIGAMVIDLTELPWNGETVEIDASIDAGNLDIYIPADVGIIGSASVDVGRVSTPGRSTGGLGDPHLNWNEPGDLGTVLLDAHVSLGNISVSR